MKPTTTKWHVRGKDCRGGFVAVTAVMILSSGILASSFAVLGSAISFAESQAKRELRIQARLNARACLDSIKLMVAKDYFMAGDFDIVEFGCMASIENDFNGNVSIEVTSQLSGVRARGKSAIQISNGAIVVTEDEVM